MLAKRIIPCLDVQDGTVVKGTRFVDLQEVGDAVALGRRYALEGADELVYLDISATREGRGTFAALVGQVADAVDIPFTVGGGIRSLDDASRLLDAGADKVTLNSAAIARPDLVGEIAAKYGRQFVVVAIDAARDPSGIWRATTHGGTRAAGRELFSWAVEAQERGAGEILFTSMDHDGTGAGYPCDVYAALADCLSIPLIASGGAGSIEDIAAVLTEGRADAALAASIFHYGRYTIREVKRRLADLDIPIRL
ncbi:MAG: imidazole glycerol phosphate synthase subunit HisF [Bacteroidales bacterium]|nr:imidazole glycerol phosphate synthase subunit HisF [Bacteroidales bacterium]